MPEQTPAISGDKTEFRSALEHTINCHSMEYCSNTPDFILAQYLEDCLCAFEKAMQHREAYFGRPFINGDAPPPPRDAPKLSAV